MTGRRKLKVLANGRNETSPQGRFVRLGHDMLASAAYRSLTPPARALLVELTSFDTGKNNGDIWLSEDDAVRRIGVGCPKVVRKAFNELTDVGFIVMTKGWHFDTKAGLGRARTWRLTWLETYPPRRPPLPPTNDWKSFMPSSKEANKRADRGLRAIAAYRKQVAQNQNRGVKSPYTPDYEEAVQVNSPATAGVADENPPLLDVSVQGNAPYYTAVTIPAHLVIGTRTT